MDRIYAQINHSEAKLAFALARYAGLRRSEVCKNLKWNNVYWDESLVVIPIAKTGEQQIEPMVPLLKEVLQESRKEDGFIVNLHPQTVTHYLSKAKKMAGIYKKGSIHILRHSLGKNLRSQNMDIRDIQDTLRHSKITTTELYTQVSKKDLLDRLSDKYI
ncbi:hypothetical protein BVY01_03020 [bacterium I07]|nr:hypothetical protein BVY01_03020 [bacterium I07]